MSLLPVATRPLSRSVGAFPLVRTPGPWLRSYRSYATGSSQTRPISTQRRAFDKRIALGAALLLSGYLFSSVVHLDGDATLDGPRPNHSTKAVAHNPPPATASQSKYGTKEEVQQAIEELKKALPRQGAVNTNPTVLQEYGSSDKSYHPTSPHSVVVKPGSTEDVVAIVNIARKYRVPIVPYSGATSMEGHFSGVSALGCTSLPIFRARPSHCDLSTHPEVSALTCLA